MACAAITHLLHSAKQLGHENCWINFTIVSSKVAIVTSRKWQTCRDQTTGAHCWSNRGNFMQARIYVDVQLHLRWFFSALLPSWKAMLPKTPPEVRHENNQHIEVMCQTFRQCMLVTHWALCFGNLVAVRKFLVSLFYSAVCRKKLPRYILLHHAYLDAKNLVIWSE